MSTTVGKAAANKQKNKFTNIVPCKWYYNYIIHSHHIHSYVAITSMCNIMYFEVIIAKKYITIIFGS